MSEVLRHQAGISSPVGDPEWSESSTGVVAVVALAAAAAPEAEERRVARTNPSAMVLEAGDDGA